MSGMPRSNGKMKKMCRNHHPEKSQGQECQGQIPRSNGKTKMGNRFKPVLTGKNGKIKNGKTKMEKPVLTGKNRKNGKWKNGKV